MEKLIALSVNGKKINGPTGVPTIETGTTLNKLISVGIELLILLALILCIVFIVWGGINWIMSEGDKQRLNQARQKVLFAVIGLIVVFLAFAIISFIFQVFGLGPCIEPFPSGPLKCN